MGAEVADAIRKIDGVVDVLDGIENTISGPAVIFKVDPKVAAREGFTAEEIATDGAAIIEGEPATTPVVLNDRLYSVRVRFPASKRTSLETISDTMLTSTTGRTATLGSLAKITELPPQPEIRRENLLRDVQSPPEPRAPTWKVPWIEYRGPLLNSTCLPLSP